MTSNSYGEEESDCTKLPRGMPPSSKVDNASNFEEAEVSMQEVKPIKEPTIGKVNGALDLAEGPVRRASNFTKGLAHFRVNAKVEKKKKVHLKPEDGVFEFNFSFLPLSNDHGNPRRDKSQQVRGCSYDRDLHSEGQDDVTWRYGPKQVVVMKGQPSQSRAILMGGQPSIIWSWEQAEVLWEFQDRPSLARSRQAMRASPDLVGENIKARELATRLQAQQTLLKVPYTILGLPIRPPNLARSLNSI
ncbi:hypothetical protein GQ457_11G023800 [Hibiscus cannabinus]